DGRSGTDRSGERRQAVVERAGPERTERHRVVLAGDQGEVEPAGPEVARDGEPDRRVRAHVDAGRVTEAEAEAEEGVRRIGGGAAARSVLRRVGEPVLRRYRHGEGRSETGRGVGEGRAARRAEGRAEH